MQTSYLMCQVVHILEITAFIHNCHASCESGLWNHAAQESQPNTQTTAHKSNQTFNISNVQFLYLIVCRYLAFIDQFLMGKL